MYISYLTHFFTIAKQDDRITSSHISLYMALFELWNGNLYENPVTFTRKKVMAASKINSISTYHKLVKELNNYGYINYIPSFHPTNGSKAFLLNLENIIH